MQLFLGEEVGHQSVGVAVPKLVCGLQQAHKLHVLRLSGLLKYVHSMGDRLSVCLLNRLEVGRWSLDFGFSRHGLPL